MELLNSIGNANEIRVRMYPEHNSFVQILITGVAPEYISRAHAILTANLTFFDEKVKYTQEFKNKITDGKVRLFHPTLQVLPIGLISKAKNIIYKGLPDYKFRVDQEVLEMFRPEFGEITREEIDEFIESINITNLKNGKKINPFEHQRKLFERTVNGRRISLLACTSSGKSLAIYMASRWLSEKKGKRVLVITPSSGLITQMHTNFTRDYGWGTEATKHLSCLYGDSADKKTDYDSRGNLIESKRILLSTWQSLRLKDPEFFLPFDVVIVDEAHGSKADELQKILLLCRNARWKIGYSGTIPDEGLDSALIEGSLGRKEVIVRTKDLVAKGILPPLTVNVLTLQVEEKHRRYLCRQRYDDETTLLASNGSRKQVVDVLIKSEIINIHTNTLLLFRKKEGMQILKQFIAENYPQFKIFVIDGDVKAGSRDECRDIVNDNIGCIIIATYGTMKQGVSIEKLHKLVLCESSKSMYEVVQSLGRVIRSHESKKEALVYDIVDDASYYTRPKYGGEPSLNENYGMEHFHTRAKYYAAEEFPVNYMELPFCQSIYPEVLEIKKAESEQKKASKKPKKFVPKKPSGLRLR